MLRLKQSVSFCLGLLALAAIGLAQPLPLSSAQLSKQGGGSLRYEFVNGAIILRMDDPRGNAALSIAPPRGQAHWDLSRAEVLALDIENLSPKSQMRLNMFIATGTWQERNLREATVGIGLNPGEKRTIRMPLPHEWKYAAPQGVPGIRTLDTSRISAISFQMQWPYEPARKDLVYCRLSNLRLEGPVTPQRPAYLDQYFPFIDAYGQFMHEDWPGKVRSAEDLRKAHAAELALLAESKRPAAWNRFGGWADGPQLEATGAFRTEKYEGKWYLVDPEGRLFFSHGLDVISAYNDALRVTAENRKWFAELPDDVTNAYQPTERALREKYGTSQYQSAYFRTVSRRLEAWGMNTIGNWSRPELMELGTTPYTLQLTDFNWRMPRLAASKVKFYDVFDHAYETWMKSLFAEQMQKHPIYARSINDPMCIGYFIDNELDFGNRGGRPKIVDDILRCPPEQAAKQALVDELRQKYQFIERLNGAWGTNHASWEAMLLSTDVPQNEAYEADAVAFFEKMVDRYFALAREAVKSVAPHRLYLGARFISTDAVRPDLYNVAARHVDVLSVNIYSFSPAGFPVDEFPDVPVLIGEFHFGILQRGMFRPSLCWAGATPEDRAVAYIRFMQGALVHPKIVGAHYFQYRDQPLTGRGDGEAYQIGFVDVTDIPYEEMWQAARQVGEHMYDYRHKGILSNSMTGEADPQ